MARGRRIPRNEEDDVLRREQNDPEDDGYNEKQVGGAVGTRGVSEANEKSRQETEIIRKIL